MLLAFDATTIRGNKTGVGYYTERLLERLTQVGGEANPVDEVLVLSNRELDLPEFPRTRNVLEGRFPVRAVWMQAVLPFVLERLRPDLCHFTNFLGPYFTDVPYVVTVHDMTLELMPRHHTWRKRLLTKALSPEIARRARHVITPSESAREDVAQLFGIDRARIRAIPHAPHPEFRPSRSEATAASLAERYGVERPYLLYVGTLEPRKNLVRTIRAFARIATRFPDHRFYLAGDLGWHSSELIATIEALGLESRVKRLGYASESDLPALYSHAELFVYPSLYEGFGFPVVEAMACGTPVVTSNTSSLAEVAGGAALRVNPFDEVELAEGIDSGLSDASLRERLARTGLARARSFSWERTVSETLEVYQEALGRATVRARPRLVSGSRTARAILDTITYGAEFDFPMRLDEIHRALIEVPASKMEVARLLVEDPLLQERIDRVPPYYFLAGQRSSIATRRNARLRTRALLESKRHAIGLVRRAPFVRMVALSGASAHDNAKDGDIDLFLVTARGRAWTVALYLFAVMKVLGLRRTLCLNYFVAEDRLELAERDPFTASQIVGMKPLFGRDQYIRLVRANAWGARFFPNFWQGYPRLQDECARDETVGSFFWECALAPFGALIEQVSWRVLGWHLGRRVRQSDRPDAVKLEPGLIKLHFNDHSRSLGERIAAIRRARIAPAAETPAESVPEVDHARSV
ncbi:MAG TPA: glycosyltransferase family 1 protein [Vicinamibacteria bacterium]|nr:glycosyltransferase family 1 protein [Vicinamibacteria bacterium]